MKYFYKHHWWMNLFSRHLIWRIPTNEKEVFLTFDDGPHDPITEEVLDLLKVHGAKASFFCIGKQVDSCPDLVTRMHQEGHLVGNHTNDHLNGWTVDCANYVNSVRTCDKKIDSTFFRPPYGKISWKQIGELKGRFSIFMWTMLSGDFDHTMDLDVIKSKLKKEVRKGDIIVFHDNLQTAERLRDVLPDFLSFLKLKGFKCSVLRDPKTSG